MMVKAALEGALIRRVFPALKWQGPGNTQGQGIPDNSCGYRRVKPLSFGLAEVQLGPSGARDARKQSQTSSGSCCCDQPGQRVPDSLRGHISPDTRKWPSLHALAEAVGRWELARRHRVGGRQVKGPMQGKASSSFYQERWP